MIYLKEHDEEGFSEEDEQFSWNRDGPGPDTVLQAEATQWPG